MKLRHVPTRAATGAFIFNSGITKLAADEESTKHLHDMAANAYPGLRDMDPRLFTGLLGAAELTLGSALLLPAVPSRLAGLGLGAFSAGLLGLYLKTPGMTLRNSIRPTQDGLALAKDSWMLGIAASLVFDGDRPHRRKKNKKA